jgi:hypothetical protein
VIVMERESFTEDGKTDSVTAAWFVWRKGVRSQRFIVRDRRWLEDLARRGGAGKRRIA